jgi:hypothetical protein
MAEEPEEAAPAAAMLRQRVARAEDYGGLPARIELPWGVRRTSFDRELLPSDAPRPVVVVLAAARLVTAVTWAAVLALLAAAWLLRRTLAEGARRLAARFAEAGALAAVAGPPGA